MDGVHVHCVWLMINLCKIMRDSKSRAITQTIHTNLVGLVCDAGYHVEKSFKLKCLCIEIFYHFLLANVKDR